MQLSRCLVGQTPLQTNIRVYDSGTLEDGALMMWNPSANSSGALTGSDASVAYFIKAAADDGTAALDAIGVLQASSTNAVGDKNNLGNDGGAYKIGTDYKADAGVTVDGNYLPCIISPQVLYFAEYYQQDDVDSGDGNVITANITASTSTTLTITDLQDDLDAGWVFSTARTSSTAYKPGQLRFIESSAATGSCVLITAMDVATTTDLILILPKMCTRTGLTDDGVGLCSLTDKTANDASEGLCVGLGIWENLAKHESDPWHPLREWRDDGLNDLGAFRAQAEVWLTSHVFYDLPA